MKERTFIYLSLPPPPQTIPVTPSPWPPPWNLIPSQLVWAVAWNNKQKQEREMSRIDFVLWVLTFWLSTTALSRQLKLTIVCSWITVGTMCGTACTLQLPSLAKSASAIPTFPLDKKSRLATSLSHYFLSGWKLAVFFTLTFRADLVVDCTEVNICLSTGDQHYIP